MTSTGDYTVSVVGKRREEKREGHRVQADTERVRCAR